MALAQFSDRFWFPSGVLAIGVAARVFPLSSNILAPLFADAAGTIPLANPLTTDATGTVTFWAEAAEYWLHIDSETFRINVGLPEVNPTAFAALQADVVALQGDVTTLQADVVALQGAMAVVEPISEALISTGVVSGGLLTANGGDPTAVDISACVAYIVDNVTTPANPTITRITQPDRTVVLDGPAQARVLTWWLMDIDGTLIQQSPVPTPQQRRRYAVLGRTAFNPLTGSVIGAKSIQVNLVQGVNQFVDLTENMKPFSVEGNRLTPIAASLQFAKSAGFMFSRGSALDFALDNPHEHATPAQSPAQFRRATQTTAAVTALVTTIDPANYDVGGVITPVGGGAGSSTIQRVWLNPADTTADQITVQYGQTVYSSLSNAAAAIGRGTFVPTAGLSDLAVVIGYIAVTRVATNLADTAQAQFVTAVVFPVP